MFEPSLSNTPLRGFQSADPPVHVPTSTMQGREGVGDGTGVGVAVGARVGVIPVAEVAVLPEATPGPVGFPGLAGDVGLEGRTRRTTTNTSKRIRATPCPTMILPNGSDFLGVGGAGVICMGGMTPEGGGGGVFPQIG